MEIIIKRIFTALFFIGIDFAIANNNSDTAQSISFDAKKDIVEIRMKSTPKGDAYFFDPVGVLIQPGQTVRWIQTVFNHSTTAYHPKNYNHELRIPEKAEPWDSKIMRGHDATFEHTFTEEGVYDYFCKPHEMDGMVGRIIVGKPLDGPGTKPFDYAPEKKWKEVPKAAQDNFPTIEEIMSKKIVLNKLSAGQ
ncbi:MAG: hypothetical protein JWQ35_653 [Bacteriovoracaceae bacterium]|nr:hypothetical protein [Bacteriovoracaceae bacterium]